MIRVGIAGAAGYTAGELIRVLIAHPHVELRYLQSESHRGEPVGRVHRDLIYTNLRFSDLDMMDIDVLFLCMGHGISAQFLEQHRVPASVRFPVKGSCRGFCLRFAGAEPGIDTRGLARGESGMFCNGNRVGTAAVGEERFAA